MHQAYEATGFMYEKYNAYVPGQGGGGGEYTPQTGVYDTGGLWCSLSFRSPAEPAVRVGRLAGLLFSPGASRCCALPQDLDGPTA